MSGRADQQVGNGVAVDVAHSGDRFTRRIARSIRALTVTVFANDLVAADPVGDVVEIDLEAVGLAPHHVGRTGLVAAFVVPARTNQDVVVAVGIEVARCGQRVAGPVTIVVAVLIAILADDLEAAVASGNLRQVNLTTVGLAEDHEGRAGITATAFGVVVVGDQQVAQAITVDITRAGDRAVDVFTATGNDLVAPDTRRGIVEVDLPVVAERSEQNIHRARRADRDICVSVAIDVSQPSERASCIVVRLLAVDPHAPHASAHVVE
ncbi:MAG: hypothetical protein V5B35_01005 [Candidatus Accumulibacter necessarius]